MAWPLLEIRTFTVTSVMLDSLAAGFIDVLSSKTKSKGNLSAVVLIIASGIREPDTGVAKTNTVSVGATLSDSSLITLTLPEIRAELAWLLAAPAELAFTEAPLLVELVFSCPGALAIALLRGGDAGKPIFSRVCAIARSNSGASGEFGSTTSRARSQKRSADR